MTIIRPDPLLDVAPEAPDRDYRALYDAAIARVGQLAAPVWSDHNQSDPGITLLQVLCWGLADAHYRVSQRGLDAWPLTTAPADPRLGDPARTMLVARALSRPDAEGLAAKVQNASSRHDALRLVVDTVSVPGQRLSPVTGHACVRLLRRDLVRRAMLDSSAVVASTVEEAAVRLGDGTTAAIDAAATALLLTDLALARLWPDEIADVVAANRARKDLERIAARADQFRTAIDRAGLDGISAALVGEGVDPDRAALAQAVVSRPPGLSPEHWEGGDGASSVWPPTPEQALRVEPVTADDYATRARAVRGVRRTWGFAGTLPGIAWHRGETVVTDRRGTLTLLVERHPSERADFTDVQLLRAVIDEVLGESAAPWSALGHRRVLGDEVGASLVRHFPVQVAAVLHCSPGTDPDDLLAAALGRVRDYLDHGRPHRRQEQASPGRGPWPDADQPADDWEPGEAIPVTELVQVLADDPLVLGVSDVQVVVSDGPVLRAPVRVAATSAVAANSASRVVDGVSLKTGDRVLLTAQGNEPRNGVYVVGPGSWERAPDLATADSLVGAVVTVLEGPEAGKAWEQTADAPILLGTSPLVWRRTARPVRSPVRIALTGPVLADGQRRLDGVRLFTGDRALLLGQEDPADNGEYEVRAGPWDRTTPTPPPGSVLGVGEGSLAGTTWRYDAAAGWLRTGLPQPAHGEPTGAVAIPAGGVPVLAGTDCLVVQLVTQEVPDA